MNYRTGDVVCGCRLEEECGRGSYGVVFVGVDTIGVRRAVKLIPCGSSQAKRELTGLRNYKKCHHRNLLAIHHVELLDDVRQKFNQRVNTATYQAFQLFALQERPVDKVADFLGCTINQVYQAKKRCLSVLDDILREFHKEDPELPAQTLKEVFLAFMDGRESIGKRDEGTSAS